ncbi:hypothetical protein [Streptomyces cyaneofuscatus]|uniref:hypothetical protein n=1 Tax=Streptomyces cyaneofuscatus TaxID=66883 RepID=UPI003440C12C
MASGTATVVDITTGTPVEPGAQEAAPRPAGREAAAGALRQVFAVLPLRRAIPDLVSGSWVLAGRGCRCVAHVVRWAWAQASDDPEAAAQLAAHTKRAAAAQAVDKAREEGEEQKAAAALAELGAAPTGRRPVLETLAYLALGGMLAAGTLATVAALAAPHLAVLAHWRPMILTVGGLGWSIAAWAVAPPPKTPEKAADSKPADGDVDQEATDDAGGEEGREGPETVLLWHVVRALADAERAGRAGVHLDAVLASATAAGLVVPDTELAPFRTWVEARGLPSVDKLGMRIGGKPVTRVGLRVDAATTALGMSPATLLTARSQTCPGGGPATPARPVGERPAETGSATPIQLPPGAPSEPPVPAVLRLLPGGRQYPAPAPSPTVPQGAAQEAR